MNMQTWTMRVKEYMKQNHMAEPGDGVLAAVSGGADSVCLLLMLKALETSLGIQVMAFHLNHGLRGEEADRDEAYVRALCQRLQVRLKVAKEDVAEHAKQHGLSEEEAGRVLRYQWLEKTAGEFDCHKIATAHHKDDQAETVLMNLFRGTGLRGLGGIRPIRRLSEDQTIIRPLLCMERQEIEAYLIEEKEAWCEDSTNRELVYSRNKVRNVLIPWIRENVNDRAEEHILKTALFASQADEYFLAQAEKLLGDVNGETADEISIDVEVFDPQPEIMKAYLIRAMIARVAGNSKDISARHIEAVSALDGPGGGTAADLPYGLRAIRGYQKLSIRKAIVPKEDRITSDNLKMRVFAREKDLAIPKNKYTKWFDYDRICDTLSVRAREPGDYFMIGDGKTKKLHRFFIDEKIPEELRDKILLLAEGNHILWVVGYRISEYYKITDATRNILEVRVDKGEDYDRES
ncbi:MAG: tRNA lysidine(34) synthetase TilS [Lachnospiraceae bacterium]|nr:tRNA lysidine(34) synthetase TilS [Lachnospiraceae bacterium]